MTLHKNVNGEASNLKNFYRLELSKAYHNSNSLSYFDIMSIIAKSFNTPLRERDRVTNYGKSSTYLIITSNFDSNKLIFDYFKTYSMFSSKLLDFNDWGTI